MLEGVNHDDDLADTDEDQDIEGLDPDLQEWVREGRRALAETIQARRDQEEREAARRIELSHEGEAELEARRHRASAAARLALRTQQLVESVEAGRLAPETARWLLDVMHRRVASDRHRAFRNSFGDDDESVPFVQITRSRLAAGKAISEAERARRRAMHWLDRAESELRRLGGGDAAAAHVARAASLLATDIASKRGHGRPYGKRGVG